MCILCSMCNMGIMQLHVEGSSVLHGGAPVPLCVCLCVLTHPVFCRHSHATASHHSPHDAPSLLLPSISSPAMSTPCLTPGPGPGLRLVTAVVGRACHR